MAKGTRYEFRGQMLLSREIADLVGLSWSLISNRLHRGIKGEDLAKPAVSRADAGRMGAKKQATWRKKKVSKND